MAGTRSHHGATFTSLRATRDAIQIARAIACPPIERELLITDEIDQPKKAEGDPVSDAPPGVICQPVIQLAPWWMMWVLAWCLALLVFAAFVILKSR